MRSERSCNRRMQIYGFEWLDGRLFKIGGFWMQDARC
jgi:hypothetical protein